MRILIKDGYLVTMAENDEKIVRKDVLIDGNKIIKIEENINDKTDKIIDAKGKVVMPGFINCHTHAAMSLFRGYADDMELEAWLKEKIWPAEDKLVGEDVYYGTLLSCIEMIKSGTTTFNDMYYFMEDTAKATEEMKMRAILSRCIMAVEDENDKRVKEAIRLYENYNGKSNGKIKVNFALHAPYTCNDKAIRIGKELAKKYNTSIHIHLDETKNEHDQIKEKYKMTPTKYLKNLGILDDISIILAHGVWLEDEDIKLLESIKGGVVYNPVSNLKLASGIAPAIKMINSGINVSLGTDGAGSTNTLDMFEEMRVASYIQKVSALNSLVISAYDVLKMATINGAKVLGMEDEIGSLEIGKKADIIIVDMDKPHLCPLNSIYSNLVYACNASDVQTTIIDGNIVMEDRKLIGVNEKDILEKCRKIARKIF